MQLLLTCMSSSSSGCYSEQNKSQTARTNRVMPDVSICFVNHAAAAHMHVFFRQAACTTVSSTSRLYPVSSSSVTEAMCTGCSRLHPDGAESQLPTHPQGLPAEVSLCGKMEVLDRILVKLIAAGHKVGIIPMACLCHSFCTQLGLAVCLGCIS